MSIVKTGTMARKNAMRAGPVVCYCEAVIGGPGTVT